MRLFFSVFLGRKGPIRPKRVGGMAILFALLVSFCSCSQTLSVPASSSAIPVTAQDFFWQNSDLSSDSELDYNVVRNNSATDHKFYSVNGFSSPNGDEIEDGTLQAITLVVHSSADSISVDSMGANSIFSLPTGYSFGRDSSAGSLLILLASKLDSGDTWLAGNLFGPFIQQGVPIYGRVLDRVDSLIVPSIPTHPGALSSFGQSIQIQYSPVFDSVTVKPPVYWIAYYAKAIGPVRIEEFSSGSIVDEAQIISR